MNAKTRPRQTSIVADRMCIVTREVMDEERLIRFVRGPDGEVVPDLNRQLPGRGVWVRLSTEQRRRGGQAPRLFARGLQAEVAAAEPICPSWSAGFCARQRFPIYRLPTRLARRLRGAAKVEEIGGIRAGAACHPCAGSSRWTAAEARPRGGPGVETVRSLYLDRIGFGVRPVKCDTCAGGSRGAC